VFAPPVAQELATRHHLVDRNHFPDPDPRHIVFSSKKTKGTIRLPSTLFLAACKDGRQVGKRSPGLMQKGRERTKRIICTSAGRLRINRKGHSLRRRGSARQEGRKHRGEGRECR